MLDYSTERTEINERKVFGLRTGFRRNLLRNPKIAAQRIESLKGLVDDSEIEYYEMLLENMGTVYEYAFKAKVMGALKDGKITKEWIAKNKYELKGKMWKYTGEKNKAYWTKVEKEAKGNIRRVKASDTKKEVELTIDNIL
jgi:hypothetical protein